MSTVTCSNCGTQSTAGKKFCAECGVALPFGCPACGHLIPPGQKFCDECGSPLAATPSPPATPAADPSPATSSVPPAAPPAEQERRLVTILFADLVGSSALGHSLDPDELYELIDRIHQRIEAQVLRYEGHVARHLGDGLMALFGAPTAHEDDAERAVLAALAMQQAVAALNAEQSDGSPPLDMRIGITSGEVVAGRMAGIYDVIGDAPNVAARLQGSAEIGGVLVGEETMRLARRRIRFGERQELALKGKPEPVAAYAAVGVREQLGERWEGGEGAGYATPLVGRERELEMVLAACGRMLEGEGQLISLVGEPGVGKSRLVAEALDRIAKDGGVRVLRARCLSYGESISLWLIVDLLRSLCSLREDEALDMVRERIASTVGATLAASDAEDRAIAADVLGEVLGLPPGGSLVSHAGAQIRRQSLVRILGLLLAALAEQQALVLVLEDVHWLDAASHEILTELLPDIPGRRMLVLTVQRPGWSAPWTEWGWTERLTLHPLPDDQAAILAGAVLGGMPLSGELEEHIRERTGGNPFFVEEMLRFLQESGELEQRDGHIGLVSGAAAKLPSTLTEVLLARLDRLESQVKGVAQVGSVIGRSFAVRLLARVMEREEGALAGSLRSLQQAEIAFPRRGLDPEYVFKHVTVRDVAYGMLVRRRQRQLHLATARAIAALYPTDEYVEMIAYHYARTEEDAEAAVWLERAGDRAGDTYAHEAAIAHYQAALERLERCGADEVKQAQIEDKVGDMFFRVSRYEEAQAVLERAVERYHGAGLIESMARATALLGRVLDWRGESEGARRRLEGIATVLEEHGPSAAGVRVQVFLATVFQGLGRYGEMLQAAERAVELARAVGDEGLRGEAAERRGAALNYLGRIEESREALEEAVHLAEEAGDLDAMTVALGNLGFNRELAGELAEAVRFDEQTVTLAMRTGFVQREIFCQLNLGSLLVATGEWERGREHLARAEEIAQSRGSAAWVAPWFPLQLGTLALREGDWAGAHQLLDRVVELSAGANSEVLEQAQAFLAELEILEGRAGEAGEGLRGLLDQEGAKLPLLLPILAWAHLELGETEQALEQAEQAEWETRARQTLLYLPDALRIKGMALSRLGRTEEARTVLTEGRERAAAMPNPYTEARILVELALLDRQEGKGDRASGRLQEALAIFRRLGARKDVERTEQALVELDRSADLAR